MVTMEPTIIWRVILFTKSLCCMFKILWCLFKSLLFIFNILWFIFENLVMYSVCSKSRDVYFSFIVMYFKILWCMFNKLKMQVGSRFRLERGESALQLASRCPSTAHAQSGLLFLHPERSFLWFCRKGVWTIAASDQSVAGTHYSGRAGFRPLRRQRPVDRRG